MSRWGFGDVRLAERAEKICEAIVATGSVVLRRLGGTRAGEIAAHRFLGNERVTAEGIIETLSARTLAACAGRRVLAVQDTTEINFAGRDASRSGLGQAGGDKSVGFFIHPLIAVDIAAEAVLGLVDAEIWTREDVPAADRRRMPFAEKESARWLRGMESAARRLPQAGEVIVAGDRENDIYAALARRPAGVEVIVRACHNRKLAGGGRLFENAHALRERGRMRVAISAKPGRKARVAEVVVRSGRVRIAKPADSIEREDPAYVEMNYVEAVEPAPPERTRPVCWRLLTSLPVAAEEEAHEVVRLYRLRWRIEEVFRALKSNGLDLESTQVEAAPRLFKLAAMALAAAARIVQLVDARDGSSRPASDVADPALFGAFEAIGRQLEGKTQRQKNPHARGTLAWLSWIVARLGGWNCYYKPPGPKTMATGWKQLATMTTGFLLAMESRDV